MADPGGAVRQGGKELPIELRTLDGGRGVSIRGGGTLTDAEFVSAHQSILSLDETTFRSRRYWLGDYSDVSELGVALGSVRDFGQALCLRGKGTLTSLIAVAVGDQLEFGLARVIQSWSGPSFEWFVTYSLDEAKAWLKTRVMQEFGFEPRFEEDPPR